MYYTDDTRTHLAPRFNQSTKWTAKVTDSTQYVWMILKRKLLLKNVLAKGSFFAIKQSNVSDSIANVLNCTSDSEDGSGGKICMICIFI